MNKNEENIDEQTQVFRIFGFVSDAARRNLIITIFVLLFLCLLGMYSQMQRNSRLHELEKQELIEHYEVKVDSLYLKIINLKN